MKDNFSAQAESYARFRPNYPEELIDCILSLVKTKSEALDVGTGNGQLASVLADHFEMVTATDISQKQLAQAIPKSNLEYVNLSAEQTTFPDACFDLITVAQAVHWFDFSKFYPEVYRILKPDGIFAVIGYGLFSTNKRADKVLRHFYKDILGPYWDAERAYIDQHYQTLPFPFEEFDAPQFSVTHEWSFGQLTGYLDTWSAVAHYKEKVGIDPLDLIRHELALIWEMSDKKVTFPFLLRIGKPFKHG